MLANLITLRKRTHNQPRSKLFGFITLCPSYVYIHKHIAKEWHNVVIFDLTFKRHEIRVTILQITNDKKYTLRFNFNVILFDTITTRNVQYVFVQFVKEITLKLF